MSIGAGRRRIVQVFVGVEAASFVLAASVHFGVLLHGYEHRQAGLAETTIASVLLVGLGLTWLWPRRARTFGLAAQGFALLGTLVGISTIIVGFGPRTVPDLAYHLTILIVLACGLMYASRTPDAGQRRFSPG